MLTRASLRPLIGHRVDFGLLSARIFGGFDLVRDGHWLGHFRHDFTAFSFVLYDRLQRLVVVELAELWLIFLHESQRVVELRHFVYLYLLDFDDAGHTLLLP